MALHVVVPHGIDDPARPSGGNLYDRRVCIELRRAGHGVRELPVPGGWPAPDPGALAALSGALAGIAPGSAVLVDGLIASAAGEVLTAHARRLRVAVLVHLPLGVADPAARTAERAVLEAALDAGGSVVATSRWTRSWLVTRYRLPIERVAVASPGVDAAPLAASVRPEGGTDVDRPGNRLVSVGALTPVKGADVLADALALLRDVPWHWTVAGSSAIDPEHAAALARTVHDAGLGDRVTFTGTLDRDAVEELYAGADLVVVPSRLETYGMVVTEALAHGLPVVTSDVGGTTEALGRAPDGSLPGMLVPPEDPGALSAALRLWLTDGALRRELRAAAVARRPQLQPWSGTAAAVARAVLEPGALHTSPGGEPHVPTARTEDSRNRTLATAPGAGQDGGRHG